MSPHQEAIAFRIWQFAEPLGWDCTRAEIASALGLTLGTIHIICAKKGWSGRLRHTSASKVESPKGSWDVRHSEVWAQIRDERESYLRTKKVDSDD